MSEHGAIDGIAAWAFSSLMLGLRIAPVFSLAPPFSMTRVPATFRALFGLAMAGCLVAGQPAGALITEFDLSHLVVTALRELFLGGVFVMAFQVMFGALYVAGRTIDIQAGFGLALLIDPTSRAQTPLVGTLFAYAAGAVFFALNGHIDLLRMMAATLDAVPIGTGGPPASLGRLTTFISAVFAVSFGVGGGAILCLFLTDAAIALMSRTVPQMNVLMLGFQVKTLLLLLVLPVSLGVSAAALARMARITLEAVPGLL